MATARITVVDPVAFGGASEALAWLNELDPDVEAGRALEVIADAVHAYRIAAMDPAARPPSRAQALVCRVGYGEGEQVSEGRWVRAVTLPGISEREKRAATLAPQERFGALLNGRDVALAAETLVLDARRDLDAGRHREAALHLRVALEAALAELVPWRTQGDGEERLHALGEQRPAVADAANAALRGGLDDTQIAAVTEGLRVVEAALRARSAAVSAARGL